MSLEGWLSECEGRVLRTLDGDRRVVRRAAPTPAALTAYTARLPLPLSGSYAAFLPLADGMEYCGVHISCVPLAEV